MEQQITIIYVYPYDIYVTEQRFVMINVSIEDAPPLKSTASTPKTVHKGIIDKLHEQLNPNMREKIANLTLDQILDVDRNRSFQIPYEKISKVKLLKFTPWDRHIIIKIKADGIAVKTGKKVTDLRLDHKITGEAYDEFKKVLPSIIALSGKVEVLD